MTMNPHSKEWQLTEALLQFTAACVAEGDMSALHELGIDPETGYLFASLSMGDMQRLARAGNRGHLLQIRIDTTRLRRLRDYVAQEREKGWVRLRLMELDAPQPLMQALFGVGSKDYADWRQALGRSGGAGRISHPTEADEARAWRSWDALGRARPGDMDGTAWVELAEHAQVDLRTLWRLIHDWVAMEDAA